MRRVALFIAATFGAIVLWQSPASAVQRATIVVPLGETVTVQYPMLTGANYQQGRRPASCSASSRLSCDTIPVELGVDAAELAAHPADYVLIVRTTWNVRAEQTVPAVGVVSDDQINTFVYTDPPRVDEDGTIQAEADAFMYASPTEISFANLPSNKYLITVENMYGYNDGYELSITFMSTTGGPGADLSSDPGATFDASSNDDIPVTESFDGDASFAADVSFSDIAADAMGADAIGAGGGGRNVSLDLAQLSADNDLDSLLGVDNGAVLRLDDVQEIGDLSDQGPPPIRNASGIVLALWLVLVPLILAAAVLFVARRRRSSFAVA